MIVFDRFKSIKTFIFDIDGVWTNGELLVTETGELLRTMNAKDGLAGSRAIRSGYQFVIITGGVSKGVEDRLRNLGVAEVYIGIRDKTKLFDQLVAEKKLDPTTALYMGDDLPDIGVLKAVHLATCPKDAVQEVLDICHYISPFEGGKGCVRDVIERVMRIQAKW